MGIICMEGCVWEAVVMGAIPDTMVKGRWLPSSTIAAEVPGNSAMIDGLRVSFIGQLFRPCRPACHAQQTVFVLLFFKSNAGRNWCRQAGGLVSPGPRRCID